MTYYPVSEEHPLLRAVSVLTLGETRALLRRSHARMMVAFFAILYALGSMALGGMLIVAHVSGGYGVEILWWNALGIGPWNYPGLLIVGPWGVLSLPFLATIAMVFVSIGVGLGVSVAILLIVRLIRDRQIRAARGAGVSTIAGLTPAMVALVTLGACCSTVAAATAGVGLVAQASGSTLNNLLVNNWFLDVFQMVVVFVALLAQELVLRVYGGLIGLRAGSDGSASAPASTPVTRSRLVAGGALRAALLVAGLTWSLAMFAQWTTVVPQGASAALWFQWLVQHQLLGVFALAVALRPTAVQRFLGSTRRSPLAWVLRVALIVGGISLVAWTPPAVAAAGAPGFVNELFGVLGLPTAWGAVPPVFAPGVALYLRWGFQYGLLGTFALVAGIRPSLALAPTQWGLYEPSTVAPGSAWREWPSPGWREGEASAPNAARTRAVSPPAASAGRPP